METHAETIRRRHVEFHRSIAEKAKQVKAKATNVYEIPNTPLGVPKVNPNPPKIVPTDEWVERQKRIHARKEPWFQIVEGPTEFDQGPDNRPTARQLQKAVAEHFGMTLVELLSERRFKNVVHARQVAMFMCKRLTMRSLPEIGRKFGGRDHTTILHGVRRVERALAKGDFELQAAIDMFDEMFGEVR